MKGYNNSMSVKTKNVDVGKADCSVVLVPQGDKDHVILNRLLSEEFCIEPVTLTDDLVEIDGHDERLRRGYKRGVRVAVRPLKKTQNKATKKVDKKLDDSSESKD